MGWVQQDDNLQGYGTTAAVAKALDDPASPLSVALRAAFGSLPALEAVPITVYGDSYGQGNQGDDQESRPFNRLAVRHLARTPTIQAVAGTRMDEIAAKVAATWTPNTAGLVGFADGCINDEKQYADNTGIPTTAAAFRTCLAYLTAAAVNGIASPAFAFGAGWSNGVASVVGSSFDIAWTGDAAHLLVGFVTGAGGTLTVKNTTGATLATITTGGYKQNFTGAVRIAGLGSGTRTLRVALTAGSATVVGLAVASPTPPLVVWDKPGQINSSSAEATRLTAYLDGCAAVAADYPSVLPVDMGAGWDYTKMISADVTHRNALGNQYATERIQSALWTRLASSLVQGLNKITAITAGPSYTTPVAAYVGPGATAPLAPTSVAATTAQQIDVTWARAGDGGATVTQQVIQTSPAGTSTWTTQATLSASAASGTVASGLTGGSSYDVRVGVTNSQGTTYSSVATATAGTLPVTLASDSFNRADAATLGSTEIGGFAWTATGGTAAIVSNQAYLTATVPANGMTATIAPAQANGTAKLTRKQGANANVGLVARVNTTNLTGYLFWLNNSTYTLSKRAGTSSYSALATSPAAAAVGDVMSLVANGSTLICKVNGTTVITVTDATYASGDWGIWEQVAGGVSVDDFSLTNAIA